MSETGFYGAASLSLDGKGRISVPARYRDALQAQAQGRWAITKHPDGCLMMFPQPQWQIFRDKVAALPMEALAWKRVFLGFVSEVQTDSAQRLLIDPVLRDFAGLHHQVLLLGLGAYFELWDGPRYQAREAATLAQSLPESIRTFCW